MPTISQNLDGIEDKLVKLGCRWWKRIKAPLTLPVQHHLLHFLVLNQKEIGVKLNKCIIVKSEMMHGNNVLISGGNMKDIGEGERLSGGGNNGSTNTGYVHTLVVSRMNLVVTGVRIMHREMVEVTGYMICST
jgi:hypothetical protein